MIFSDQIKQNVKNVQKKYTDENFSSLPFFSRTIFHRKLYFTSWMTSANSFRVLTTTEYAAGETLLDGFYHSEHGHHVPTSTWNGFREIVPGRRIDYIFVNSGFNVLQHGILADIRDGHFPSDHLPVIAGIEFSEHKNGL